jgi:SAM-dependent methyltransferase
LISSYDSIAGMYDRYWDHWYLPAALPALEALFFSEVPAGSSVLDLCCGSGHVTRELAARPYHVIGVDSSAELIEIAKRRLPAVAFTVQDVRRLALERPVDAALSTFDSFNHLLSLEDLRSTFRSVRNALKDNGLFVFDMNLEEAWSLDLHNWNATVNDDSVSLVRGSFDPVRKIAATELIWFARNENVWERHTSVVEERCYSEAEILDSLQCAGFREIGSVSAYGAGITAELGFGRMFFHARA